MDRYDRRAALITALIMAGVLGLMLLGTDWAWHEEAAVVTLTGGMCWWLYRVLEKDLY